MKPTAAERAVPSPAVQRPAPPPPLKLRRDVPLAPRTSLRLGGSARLLCEVGSAAAAIEAAAWARAEGLPIGVLGGGSNTIVADEGFSGLVMVPSSTGICVRAAADPPASADAGAVEVSADAGLAWDDLVAFAVRRDLAGVAALSGIPGRVGAAPVQNIGAYGEALADVFVAAEVVDLAAGSVETWDAARAAFGYRDSAWKRLPPGAALITRLTLRLQRRSRDRAHYPELRAALTAAGHDPDAAPLGAIRRAVLALRGRKAMVLDALEPESRSVGSFFVNPVVAEDKADALALAFAAAGPMPRWPAGPGRSKLSAAWLIERAGFRRGDGALGPARGDALGPGVIGISRRHALALVHRGGGTTAELHAFAAQIMARVSAATGVALEREPVVLGAAAATDPAATTTRR